MHSFAVGGEHRRESIIVRQVVTERVQSN